jgi:hypothetical protein
MVSGVHLWAKPDTCLSELGLPHSTWWPLVPSISPANYIFILLYDWITFLCIYHTFFIHSSSFVHLGQLHSLTIVNNVVVSMGVQASLPYFHLLPFSYLPRSGVAGLRGSPIFRSWEAWILIYIPANCVFTLLPSWGSFPLPPKTLSVFVIVCFILFW